MELLSVFLIGLAGSFHCIGMCGPIALALPVSGFSNKNFLFGRVLYNIGRVVSYALLGALFGLLGGKIIVSGFQQGLSITLGIFILVTLAVPLKYRNLLLGVNVIQRSISLIKRGIGSQFGNKRMSSLFIIGILNGFLPCGFVYIGLAAAAAAGGLINGTLTMLMFGLGTVPVLLAVSTFGRIITVDVRRKISKIVPYFAAVLAIIFILRGLNLGIKYLSPKLSKHTVSLSEGHCSLPSK